MAIPPVLAVNNAVSGAYQVYRVLAGTSAVAVGGTIPQALEAQGVQYFQQNRVVFFKGSLFCMGSLGTYKHDKIADTWALVHTPGGAANGFGQINQGGIYILHDEVGSEHVAVVTGHDQTLTRMYSSTTGESGDWVARGTGGLKYAWSKAIVYRNQIFHIVANTVQQIDLLAPTMTEHAVLAPTYSTHADLCILNGDLYLLTGGSTGVFLKKFSGGTFVLDHTFSLNGQQVPDTFQQGNTSLALWTDGTDLFALYQLRSAGGGRLWDYFQLDTPGAWNETWRQADLPDGWGPDEAKSDYRSGVDVIVDNETDPTTPTFHIFHRTLMLNGARTYYELPVPTTRFAVDGSSAWPAGQNSILGNYALSAAKMGGGHRFWTNGDLSIGMAAPTTPATGAIIFSFTAHGDPVVLSHDIAGTGTIVVGDTVTGATSSATGTVVFINNTEIHIGGVVGTFLNGEDIYETVDVNYVVASSAPSGGASDKTVTIYVDGNEEIPQTLAVLQGTATGGSATRSGNTIINCLADGVTVHTVEVNTIAMGLTIGQRVTWQLQVAP